MTSTQYTELLAYDSIEPIGEERADLRAGMVCATIANMSGKILNQGNTAKPIDYMPYSQEKQKPQTGADHLRIFKEFSEAHNAAVLARRE